MSEHNLDWAALEADLTRGHEYVAALEAEVERLTKWANDANQLTLRYESRAKWLEAENAALKAEVAISRRKPRKEPR